MSCLKSWDGFAKPVQFTYKGEDEFATAIGGIASIITLLLVFIYGCQQLLFLFIAPDFSETIESTFADFNTNEYALSIDTEQTTLATKLTLFDSPIDVETLGRIQFYQAVRDDKDTINFNFVNAVRCLDLYATEITESTFYMEEFGDKAWICPNLRNIDVLNNPFLFSKGRNFVMVVNDCEVAAATDAEKGLKPYTDKGCADKATIQANIADVRVEYKIMSQNFNPSDYKKNDSTTTVIRKRFTTDLMTEFVQSMKYTIVESTLLFFDEWFVDLRDFTFFIQGYLSSAKQFNIKILDFEFAGTATFAKSFQTDAIFGYFAVDWSQSENQKKHVVTRNTFTGILSNLGGYSTVITGAFAILIGSYQAFNYDKSMMKLLYFQHDREQRPLDENGELRDDQGELIERINNRRIFRFGYFGYGLIKMFTACLCCQKYLLQKWPLYRRNWLDYQKYKKARADLRREKDVEHMIYNMRILKFIEKTTLKKRQRDIVQYFMRYLIEDDEINERDISHRDKTANQLIENFDAVNDPFDRRILFEVAKRRVVEEDYAEDTSFEDVVESNEQGEQDRLESLNFLRSLLDMVNNRVEGQENSTDDNGYGMSIPSRPRLANDSESPLLIGLAGDDDNPDRIN